MESNDLLIGDLTKALEANTKLLEQSRRVIESMQSKAAFYDAVADSDSLFEMPTVAKVLNFKGMGRNRLFEFLRDKKILRYNNEPYQQFVDRGYFKIIEQSVDLPCGNTIVNSKTMATQRGLDFIRQLLTEEGHEYNERQSASN